MGEMTMGAGEFKATCLKLMDSVAETGATYTITKRGKPVARLVPVEADTSQKPIFGALKDITQVLGDIESPLTGFDYDTAAKWDRKEREAEAYIAAKRKARRRK